MSAYRKVRRGAAALLDEMGLKAPLRRGVVRLLDAAGVDEGPVERTLEELAERVLARSGALADHLPPVQPGRRVVILGGRTLVKGVAVQDALLAWALRLRGAEVRMLVCDGPLTATEQATVNFYPSDEAFLAPGRPVTCDACFLPARSIFGAFRLPVSTYGELVPPGAWARAEAFAASVAPRDAFAAEYGGIGIGEHVQATAYRTLLRGTLDPEEPLTAATIRRLLANAVVMAEMTRNAFEVLRPDHLLAHHGVYLTSGIPCELARKTGVHVVNYSQTYRRFTTIWSHDDTYHRTIAEEPVERWRDLALLPPQRALIQDYLSSHWKGGWDWVSYNRDNSDDPELLRRTLELDPALPVVGIFTNIQWDARINYAGTAFPGHAEWLVETVRYAIRRPDVQWVVRCHPAEVKHTTGRARERADEIIHAHFPQLPEHVKVVAPESPLSSYALVETLKAAVVYGTKLGIEMGCRGLPVIVAGEAWYRNKGFTLDPVSEEEYFRVLDGVTALEPLDAATRETAMRYAYHYFFRRMIPFPLLRPEEGGEVVRTLADLAPGRNPDLDVVCRAILEGAPFATAG